MPASAVAVVVVGARRGLAGVPGRRPNQPSGNRASSSAAAGAEAGGSQDERALASAYDALRLRAVDAAGRGQRKEAWALLDEIERAGWQPRLPERADEGPRDGDGGNAEPRLAHIEVALKLVHRGLRKDALHALLRLRRMGAAGAAALASGTPHRVVVNATANMGNAWATLQMLEEMKAQGLPAAALSYCYNLALHACAKAPRRPARIDDGDDGERDGGCLGEARTLFEELLRTEPGPNVINYNTYLLVLARHGRVEEARRLLPAMEARGVRPNAVSFNTVMAAGAAAGAWPAVRQLLDEMEATPGLAPDVVSYNTAMSALRPVVYSFTGAPDGRAALALGLLDKMRDKGLKPDATTYNILLDVCRKSGQLEAAHALLPAMKAEGQGPDRVTYNTLAEGYLWAGRFADASALLAQAQEDGCRPDTVTPRLELTALAGLRRDAEVEASVRQAMGLRGRGRALETALLAMVSAGRVRDGIALVGRLEEGGSNQETDGGGVGGSISDGAWLTAVRACRGAGDLEGGIALLAEVGRRGLPVTTALALPLAKLATRQQDWTQMLALVARMEQHAPGGRLDRVMHNARLRALASLGDAAGCRAALASMRAQGVAPDGESYSWTLRAERAGGAGNAGGIRRMLHEVRGGNRAPVLTPELAQAQIAALRKVGDWRAIMALLDRIARGAYEGVRVTTTMANNALAALAQQNLWGPSLELIGRMGRDGEGEGEWGGAPADAVTYLHHGVALGQLGRWEEAVALLHQVRNGALGRDVAPLEGMYTTAVAACARAGRLAEAQAVQALREADGFEPTPHSLNTLLQAHARVGDVEAARRVLGSFEAQTGEAPDVVSYNSLIEAHRKRGTPLGDADGVLGVYRRLLAEGGPRPDVTTHTALLAACVPEGQWPVALYLHGEAEFLLRAGADPYGGSSSLSPQLKTRSTVLLALLGVLEQLGVDGLFAARAYGEAARGGIVAHWARDREGCGIALDFHAFSRPMAKAALAHVLEHDFVQRFAGGAAESSSEAAGAGAGAGIIRPLVIIVGRGRHSPNRESLLKKGVQRFLASLDPPLRAVSPPHNAGRLVVSASQLRAYVEAQQLRRVPNRNRLEEGEFSGVQDDGLIWLR